MDRKQMIEELELWYMDSAIDMSGDGDGDPMVNVDGELVTLKECVDNLHGLSDDNLDELYGLYVKSKLVAKLPEVPDVMKGVLDSIQVGFKK